MLRVPGSRGDLLAPAQPGRRRARGLLAARRGARWRAGNRDRAGGVLRHRLRDHRAGQRHGHPAGAQASGSTTSRCCCRTCWCRRRSPPSCRRRATACRASSAPGTSAPSWASASTRRWPRATACPSSSAASSRSICLQGILLCRAPARGGPRRGREPVRAHRRRATATAPRASAACARCSRWSIASGAASAPSPSPAFASVTSTAPTTPSADSPSTTSRRASRRCASAGSSCAGSSARRTAPRSAAQCTPETPLGATMVSSEGACAAYYQYGRRGAA